MARSSHENESGAVCSKPFPAAVLPASIKISHDSAGNLEIGRFCAGRPGVRGVASSAAGSPSRPVAEHHDRNACCPDCARVSKSDSTFSHLLDTVAFSNFTQQVIIKERGVFHEMNGWSGESPACSDGLQTVTNG
jgi:hypothetical protein